MSTLLRQRLFFGIEMHSIPAPTPSAAGSLTEFLTALAAVVGSRQPRKVPPLHTAQAVHEVVAEEYRISGLSELRVGDLLAGRLGVSLRDPIFGSAFHRDWLSLLSRVPSRGSCKLGLVACQ